MGKIDTPIQKVLNQLMKESDNLNAQALLCRLGAQVTGKKQISDREALEATKAMISKLGYDPAQYNLADGCGLSNYNYISPELLVCFLKYAYSHTDIFRRLYKALPIGGVDGTLKNRMKRGSSSYKRVHAKTGSFTAINCLAGYLKADNGHKIAFAIMNQNALSASQARNFQDAVCDKIIDTLK
jgi:D-alanyl-D-alanine carboxypeptidase/D-alanyl-D-alanine-endopeptidase (penicillin-binding protein 4)